MNPLTTWLAITALFVATLPVGVLAAYLFISLILHGPIH